MQRRALLGLDGGPVRGGVACRVRGAALHPRIAVRRRRAHRNGVWPAPSDVDAAVGRALLHRHQHCPRLIIARSLGFTSRHHEHVITCTRGSLLGCVVGAVPRGVAPVACGALDAHQLVAHAAPFVHLGGRDGAVTLPTRQHVVVHVVRPSALDVALAARGTQLAEATAHRAGIVVTAVKLIAARPGTPVKLTRIGRIDVPLRQRIEDNCAEHVLVLAVAPDVERHDLVAPLESNHGEAPLAARGRRASRGVYRAHRHVPTP